MGGLGGFSETIILPHYRAILETVVSRGQEEHTMLKATPLPITQALDWLAIYHGVSEIIIRVKICEPIALSLCILEGMRIRPGIEYWPRISIPINHGNDFPYGVGHQTPATLQGIVPLEMHVNFIVAPRLKVINRINHGINAVVCYGERFIKTTESRNEAKTAIILTGDSGDQGIQGISEITGSTHQGIVPHKTDV